MNVAPLAVAHVNTRASRGGAENVARQLVDGLRRRGHDAWLLVGRGEADLPGVLPFPTELPGSVAHAVAGAGRIVDRYRGLETYRYPRSRNALNTLPRDPDIVHLHNLHGGYFDLRMLPSLSRRVPVVLTLHDAWLLSGHCAHSFACERWRTGCGECPDLTIYPAIRRDATARNWTRKREIFADSRLFVSTPSNWLADRVRVSMMAAGVDELRVIPNGVDLRTFRPGRRAEARTALGISHDDAVLLIAGNESERNAFKDFPTMRAAAIAAAERVGRTVVVFVLGDRGEASRHGRAEFRRVPYLADPANVARYIQAADVYLHAARADTFPGAVIEAMACGTPVVATATGGIPEQLDRAMSVAAGTGSAPDRDRDSGILTPLGDAAAMGDATALLVDNAGLRTALGANAARRASRFYDAERQCDAYLEWYRSIRAASA